MKSLLVYRFSALGDVLLCYPVLKSVLALNPDVEIIFVTQKFLSPLFSDIPRLTPLGIDLKKEGTGLINIYKLSQSLKKNYNFDAVCDLHQVTRTRLLNFFIGKKTYKVDKGRWAKRNFIKDLKAKPLPHSTERYLKVFSNLGLKVPSDIQQLSSHGFEPKALSPDLISFLKPAGFKLGMAPFAKHFTKTWPKNYFEEFLALNESGPNFQIYLFGGPGEEAEYFSKLEQKHSNVKNLAGKFKFKDEITLMQAMDQMVVMDSANMHLASLSGTPLISIWGGTHPDIGFYPISKNAETLQVDRDKLNCRPCSVFGRANCPKKHFNCMLELKPKQLMEEVTAKYQA